MDRLQKEKEKILGDISTHEKQKLQNGNYDRADQELWRLINEI